MTRPTQCLVLLTVVVAILAISLPVSAEDPQKININTATVEELTALKQIGPAYAAAIVEYRETIGPFKSPEQIMEIKGIGEKVFELNKDVIAVE